MSLFNVYIYVFIGLIVYETRLATLPIFPLYYIKKICNSLIHILKSKKLKRVS